MTEKILFVDDDSNLLASIKRSLGRQLEIETAEGGEAGLQKVSERGPFAVVVADMQMPRMNGVQFLAAVRERAPGSVRIMLTGQAGLEMAIQVVNEGNIFRFLTKPCPPEVLTRALSDALSQYRLVTAEKELLNQTLSGSIKLLIDILSIGDPQSFGRAQQLRGLVTSATGQLNLSNSWEVHLAVMLAAIGNVTIPPEIIIKSRTGQILSKVEEQMLSRAPETAARLLANIPRLQGVARIIRYQHKRFDGSGSPPDNIAGDSIPEGARIVKIFTDMMQLQASGASFVQALEEMKLRQGWYDPSLLEALRTAHGAAPASQSPTRPSLTVPAKGLASGMLLRSNLETKDGILILAAGHQINDLTLEKILNFERISGIKEPIFVESPTPPAK